MPRVQLTIARRERAENRDPLVFEINGEDFTCQAEMSEFVLMELASAGTSSGSSMEASTAFITFIRDVLEPESYSRFRALAIAEKWTVEDMLPFVQEAVEQISARPTISPSDSPDGPSTTSTPSKENSSSESVADATVADAPVGV